MTEQEIFDTGVGGVIAQGKLARGGISSQCKYRLGSLKCAVGHLIDDATGIEWDEIGIITEIPTWKVPEHLLPHIDFLESMQVMHDASEDIEDFRKTAKVFAAKHEPPLEWKFDKENTDA